MLDNTMITAALVSTARLWHGGEAQLHLLAEGLRQRGHHVLILARRDGVLAARMQAEGFRVLPFHGRGRSPLALWQIRRALRHIRPDLLLMNDAHALTATSLAAAGIEIPVRIAARRVDFPVRSPKRYQQCDRVVCVSQGVAAVCRAGGIDGEKLRVVHDGVDPRRVRSGNRERGRAALGVEDGTRLLLTVATLTDHKGHRYLLDALPAVLARHPNVCLALAGDGELTAQLTTQAESLGIAEHVRFLGFRDDVPDLVRAADLFVLPSHLEGLCTSLIDAMLAQRAVVATAVGGIPDLFAPAQEDQPPLAWLVPPRDPVALADAILTALDSPTERAARVQRACQRAEQHFTADHMVEGTLAVYQEVASQGLHAAA